MHVGVSATSSPSLRGGDFVFLFVMIDDASPNPSTSATLVAAGWPMASINASLQRGSHRHQRNGFLHSIAEESGSTQSVDQSAQGDQAELST